MYSYSYRLASIRAESINDQKIGMWQAGKRVVYCVIIAFQVVSKPRKRCILANEEAVGNCKRTRCTDHHEPDVVGRRASLYRCGPYLEGVMLEKSDHIEREKRNLHSRRGEVLNLVQERLCSARHHLQSQQLVAESLEQVNLDFPPTTAMKSSDHVL